MLKYSFIVFIHAILLSFESIFAEFIQNSLEISILTLISISLPISGATLLLIHFTSNRKESNLLHMFKHFKYLFPAAILLSIGIFTWYDSASRIGASKDGLIAGAVEIIIVLLLAHLILKEHLTKIQTIGALLAITGFFITISIGNNTGPSINYFSLGDFESIVSAICVGSSYLFTVKLVSNNSPIKTTGFLLLLAGLIFIVITSIILVVTKESIFRFNGLGIEEMGLLILFSFVPLSSALFYNIGLKKLGASITSILASSTIILTIIFQVSLNLIGYTMILPLNISMAILGGLIATLGIIFIHLPSDKLFSMIKRKHNDKLYINNYTSSFRQII